MTIWKYVLVPVGFFYLSMPMGAQVVSIGRDGFGQMCCWAIVDPNAPMEDKALWFGGTGWPLPRGFKYIGMLNDDEYIWHLGEVEVEAHDQM